MSTASDAVPDACSGAAERSLEAEYFDSYGDPGVHRVMVGDHVRTDAYRRALEALVRPGMRVLDVGTGSGILALVAARAGAEVVAVDESPILEVARRVAARNGLADRITFVRGRAEELALEQPVDLLVSEWMGFFALAELMFPAVAAARDRHLSPGGTVVPGRLQLSIAPLEDSTLHVEHGVGLWERPVHGFDFRDVLELELEHPIATWATVRPSALLGPAGTLVDLDLSRASAADLFFDAELELAVERAGRLHGLGGWFAVDLAPGVRLGTGPEDPPTHWRQTYFPLRPFAVRAGDVLGLTLQARPKEYGDRRLPLYFLELVQRRRGEEIHRCFYRHEGSFD